MTWFIEILAIAGDESDVQSGLKSAGYEIIETNEENRTVKLLSHSKYESFQAANDIYLDSIEIERRLRKFSRLKAIELGIQFGPVRSKNLHGSIQHIFSNVLRRRVVKAEWREMTKPALSAEALKKRAEEAAAQEAEQRNALVALIGAALENPTVLKVMELLSIKEPSPTELGHIFDLVKGACPKKDLSPFANDAQINRFGHSINHPEVFGLTARHAVSRQQPPADPMTYDEARLFARRVGESWLDSLKRDP